MTINRECSLNFKCLKHKHAKWKIINFNQHFNYLTEGKTESTEDCTKFDYIEIPTA